MKKLGIALCTLLVTFLSACVTYGGGDVASHLQSNSSDSPSFVSSIGTSSTQSTSSSATKHLKLHDSDLTPPAAEQCQTAQAKAMEGMSSEEQRQAGTIIRKLHMKMEQEFVENEIRDQLKDSNHYMWNFWEHSGVVEQPDGTKIESDFAVDTIIAELQKVIDSAHSQDFIIDLQEMQNVTKDAVKNHDVDKLDTLHRMLHDCDYWLVNFPAELEYAPFDWDGVNVYFDILMSLQ